MWLSMYYFIMSQKAYQFDIRYISMYNIQNNLVTFSEKLLGLSVKLYKCSAKIFPSLS